MSALDLVRHLTSVAFVLVAVAVIARAARDPRPARIDAALFFGGLAALVLMSYVTSALGVTLPPWVGMLSVAALLALPWLELRLVAAHAEVDRRIVNAAAIAFALSTAVIVLLPSPPAIIGLFIVIYFFGAGSYAAFALLRRARARSGPTQERIRAGAAGAFLLGLALLAALLRPISADLADVATRLIALASALAFVAAFTPPWFVRQAWNEPVLRELVHRSGRLIARLDPTTVVRDVEQMASDTMGATEALVLRAPDDAATPSALEHAAREALTRGRPVAGEDNVLAAPIALGLDRFGAIAVKMSQRPMFVDAAIEMLGLVAAQSAAVLTAADALSQVHVRNADLETANRAANEATRAKSEFLASMSHELRTPLNSILGFSDLLTTQLAASLNERQTRYLRNIHEAGAHLLQLINDVLDLSKVEARRIELRQENVALDALLAPVRQTAMAEAERRGLHFETKIEPDLVVNLDPLRTRQILLNLISNAAKFTPKGGTITLRAKAEEDELLLEVEDTGIGIPADKVGRVFGTFERFHEGRYEAEGTGLGLALTKQLVELHGGTIEFETAEGKGTCFAICLPQVIVPLADDRLLVVDDEPRDAQLIAALAAREGFEVEVATSAQSALAAIRRRLPVAVVLDLRLPDGRGETILEELRRLAPRGSVPTIVATVEDDEGASRLNGADDHLTKPLDHARLTGWLKQVAARRAEAAERTKGGVHAAATR